MTVPKVPLRQDRDDDAAEATRRRKRSFGITLFALGAGAAAMFAASQDGRCRQDSTDRTQDCRSSGSGGHGGFGGGQSSASSAARGGFGGAGAAHGGGG